MLEKFSVGFLMEDRKKKQKDLDEGKGKKSYANLLFHNKEALSDEITFALINFGFNFEQIISAHKIYKFDSLDYAVQILMKDSETGQIEHKFIEQLPYSKTCKLCNYTKDEHKIDEEIKKEDKINIKSKDEEQALFTIVNGEEKVVQVQKITRKVPLNSEVAKKLTVHKNIEFSKEVLETFEEPNLCYISIDEGSYFCFVITFWATSG